MKNIDDEYRESLKSFLDEQEKPESLVDFIVRNHPDPDSLLGGGIESWQWLYNCYLSAKYDVARLKHRTIMLAGIYESEINRLKEQNEKLKEGIKAYAVYSWLFFGGEDKLVKGGLSEDEAKDLVKKLDDENGDDLYSGYYLKEEQ